MFSLADDLDDMELRSAASSHESLRWCRDSTILWVQPVFSKVQQGLIGLFTTRRMLVTVERCAPPDKALEDGASNPGNERIQALGPLTRPLASS
jgi:hypothetical protein